MKNKRKSMRKNPKFTPTKVLDSKKIIKSTISYCKNANVMNVFKASNIKLQYRTTCVDMNSTQKLSLATL